MVKGNYTKILVRSVLYPNILDQSSKPVPIIPNFMVMEGNKLPNFPCITLGMKGYAREDYIADVNRLYLSVWSKTGQDDLWFIYNQVRKLLNYKSIEGSEISDYHQILMMREYFTDDNLYDQKTFSYQLASRYMIDFI